MRFVLAFLLSLLPFCANGQIIFGSDHHLRLESNGASMGVYTPNQTCFVNNTQFFGEWVYINGALVAGYGHPKPEEHWMINNGPDNVTNYINRDPKWYSAACFFTSEYLKVGAVGMANPDSAWSLRDRFYLHTNSTEDGWSRFSTMAPILDIGADFTFDGYFLSRAFIEILTGQDGVGTAIRGVAREHNQGPIALWADASARVGVGTKEIDAEATLTTKEIALWDGGPTVSGGIHRPTAKRPDGSLYLQSGVGMYVRERGVWIKK